MANNPISCKPLYSESLLAAEAYPRPPSTYQRSIHFVHPGYDEDKRHLVLLSLPVLDNGGIDYETALVACGIITGNRWDGFFSTQRDAATRVPIPADHILRGRWYFFHLPGAGGPYPVIAGFSDWIFPEGPLPDHWEALRMSPHFLQPLGSPESTRRQCVLAANGVGTLVSHLIPIGETDWAMDNGMALFTSGTTTSSTDPVTDIISNSIPLRADIHIVFDEQFFSFIPKTFVEAASPSVDGAASGAAASGGAAPAQVKLVCHVFKEDHGGELAFLWHNRPLHRFPKGVVLEFLFARLAWTLFGSHLLGQFFGSAINPRAILVRNKRKGQLVPEEADVERCRILYQGQRSRSPKKRNAASAADAADSGYFATDSETDDDEPPRGRTLKRKADEIEEFAEKKRRLEHDRHRQLWESPLYM